MADVLPPQTLDVHTHAMPTSILEWLAAHDRADLSDVPSGIVRLSPEVSGVGADAPLPLAVAQYDVSARLADMDAVGVGHHAVSLPPFLFCSMSEDEDLVREVTRRGNDALAEFCAQSPDRLHALGTIPVGWSFAADEARRCLDELGMPGLAMGTRGGGRDLDDAVNEDVWQVVSERRTFVFLHPSGVPDPHRMTDYWLPQLVGYPMETALAGARLAFGGVLERHEFSLCLAHGGGCLPWLRGRLDLGWERKAVARTTPSAPSVYLRRMYVDTAVFSDELLRHLADDLGADHLLMGTDYPFELGDTDPLGTIDRADIDRGAVAWHTAAGLLRLDDASSSA